MSLLGVSSVGGEIQICLFLLFTLEYALLKLTSQNAADNESHLPISICLSMTDLTILGQDAYGKVVDVGCLNLRK